MDKIVSSLQLANARALAEPPYVEVDFRDKLIANLCFLPNGSHRNFSATMPTLKSATYCYIKGLFFSLVNWGV